MVDQSALQIAKIKQDATPQLIADSLFPAGEFQRQNSNASRLLGPVLVSSVCYIGNVMARNTKTPPSPSRVRYSTTLYNYPLQSFF